MTPENQKGCQQDTNSKDIKHQYHLVPKLIRNPLQVYMHTHTHMTPQKFNKQHKVTIIHRNHHKVPLGQRMLFSCRGNGLLDIRASTSTQKFSPKATKIATNHKLRNPATRFLLNYSRTRVGQSYITPFEPISRPNNEYCCSRFDAHATKTIR